MNLRPDTKVLFCQNGAWVTLDADYYKPCGELCVKTTYGELPDWAKQELREQFANVTEEEL